MTTKLVSVQSRHGWCATNKKTLLYAESIKTICGYYVTGSWGIERRKPDCKECLRVLEKRKKK